MKRKYLKKSILKSIGLTLFWLIVISCQNTDVENESLSNLKDGQIQSMIISVDEAEAIALNSFDDLKRARLSTAKVKTISKTVSLINNEDQNADPLMHFVNFKEGGYSIISGDKRYPEIMAVVDEGSILKLDSLPGGIKEWVNLQMKTIKELKRSKLTKVVALSSSKIAAIVPGLSVAPILTTRWGQGCGYNQLISTNCSSDCGKAPTGCVATAMAQVLRKWAYPASLYNWGAMPNNAANTQVALMMNYAGFSVKMNYKCSGSGAFASKIDGAFKNNWGYSSATIKRYGPASQNQYLDDVIRNLNSGQPVILTGNTKSVDILGFEIGSGDGHCWVTDGYYSMVDPCGTYDIRSNRCFARTSYYLHMNWGWEGGHNGYFVSTYWSADDHSIPMPYDFSSSVAAVIDIHP